MAKIVSAGMKALMRERDRLSEQAFRLFEQSEAIRQKMEGVELAISILKGEQQEAEKPAGITNVKGILLDFAREVAGGGLNANIAVKMAEKKGIKLKRGTAASNLSRLKADGALVHDGKRYKLPEFTRPAQMQLAVHAGGKSS
jgi:hypothetical protein